MPTEHRQAHPYPEASKIEAAMPTKENPERSPRELAEYLNDCGGGPDKEYMEEPINDPVDHPSHYTSHPSGVECIDVTEHYNFNVGNCIKYVWRAGLKNDAIEDLKKARWYLDREIARRVAEQHVNTMEGPTKDG